MYALKHTSILTHPGLFAQAVESAVVIFLSIYIETADFPCGMAAGFLWAGIFREGPEPGPCMVKLTEARTSECPATVSPLPRSDYEEERFAFHRGLFSSFYLFEMKLRQEHDFTGSPRTSFIRLILQ